MSSQQRLRARPWRGRRRWGEAPWLAGVLWLLAGVLAALFVVRGPAGADSIDVIFGIAAGLAWPLYEVTGDLDRLRLRRIVPAPEAVQPARARPARFALGVAAAGAALLAIAHLALPAEALDVSVAGLTVAIVFALATTGRAAQLWWWERHHPGERLLCLSDDDGSWIASQARPSAHAAEAAFGR